MTKPPVGYLLNEKESSLIPTLGSENRGDVSTECFGLHQGGSANASVSPKPTIFTKILNKEIPADIVYEDDKVAKVT